MVITQDRRSIIEESMQWFTLDQRKVLRPNMVHISSVHDKYDLLSLIIFAGEYKRLYSEADMGRKQLIYVLSTAQSQRRALGLPRRTIFGFVSVQSSVEVYGSWWNRNVSFFPQPSRVIKFNRICRKHASPASLRSTSSTRLISSISLPSFVSSTRIVARSKENWISLKLDTWKSL